MTREPGESRERMTVVIVGHVDHGKSTVIGRLLADTGSLPEGKLDQVKAFCARNSRPFEYAFLLDALKEEQSQGITIDCARSFFKTAKRDYILTDAPGHAAFLKNMATGAARAEAALLVIDAKEGIRENTRRHGYLLSLLGVRQIAVLVNKMDQVRFDLSVFEKIKKEFSAFLKPLRVQTTAFIPICARDGHNIASRADWYRGPTVLEALDDFVKPPEPDSRPFRFPVQDIYKFTETGDQRRILAGTVESGRAASGDRVVFFPSRQASRLKTVESFNRTVSSAGPGEAAGFTLDDDPFIRPGELMCREGQPPPVVGSRFRVSLFWMGVSPLVAGKKYKLKLGSARATARLARVLSVLDASDMASARGKESLDRHDVAECILETTKPIAFDLASGDDATGRFVLVDHYDIAGGGVVLDAAEDGSSTVSEHVHRRESRWEGSSVPAAERAVRYGHGSTFVLLTGSDGPALESAGRALESMLFSEGRKAYFLGMRSIEEGLDSDVQESFDPRDEWVRRLGELARILTDSGQIFITALTDLDEPEGRELEALNAPNEIVVVRIGSAWPGAFPAGLTLPEAGAEASARDIHRHLIERAVIPNNFV